MDQRGFMAQRRVPTIPAPQLNSWENSLSRSRPRQAGLLASAWMSRSKNPGLAVANPSVIRFIVSDGGSSAQGSGRSRRRRKRDGSRLRWPDPDEHFWRIAGILAERGLQSASWSLARFFWKFVSLVGSGGLSIGAKQGGGEIGCGFLVARDRGGLAHEVEESPGPECSCPKLVA